MSSISYFLKTNKVGFDYRLFFFYFYLIFFILNFYFILLFNNFPKVGVIESKSTFGNTIYLYKIHTKKQSIKDEKLFVTIIIFDSI
jgi:hypothetical protein